MRLTARQIIEKNYYNKIVHNKQDNKKSRVINEIPSFADYNNDLFDCALQYLGNINGQKILDIGCSDGEFVDWFAQKSANAYGIDISDQSILLANNKNNCNKAVFYNKSAENTGFPDNCFDKVFINVSLHHFEIEQALDEIKRILKPGGRLIIIEPFVFSKIIQKIRESKLVTAIIPIRRETPAEQILDKSVLKSINKNFVNIKYTNHRLLSPVIYKNQKVFCRLAKCFLNDKDLESSKIALNKKLQNFDQKILRLLPFLKIFSRYIVLRAEKDI